jgi:hypothetical protein
MKKRNYFILLFSIIPSSSFAALPFVLDACVKGGNNRNYAQISSFTPIVENADNLFFNDTRLMHHLPHSKSSGNYKYKSNIYEMNFGLGYRHAIKDDIIMGGAAYFDIRKSNINNKKLSQSTVNLHFLTPSWQLNVNGYIPLGTKQISKKEENFSGKAIAAGRDILFIYDNNIVSEKAMSGFDFKVSRPLPSIDNFRVGLVAYQFKGYKSVRGLGTDINWQVKPDISLEANYTYDKIRKSNIMVGVRFFFSNRNLKNLNSKERLFSTKVERDLDIFTSNINRREQTKIKQNKLYGVKPNDLSNINDSTHISQNSEVLSSLTGAIKDNKTLVLLETDKEFDYAKVKKLDPVQYNTEIGSTKDNTKAELSKGKNMDEINEQHARELDPLIRQAMIIGVQQAFQEQKKNHNIIYIGNKVVTLPSAYQEELYKLYAKSAATPKQSYYYNLPGIGNVEVERAGTILLVKKDNNIYAILATDANSVKRGNNPWHSWFSGQAEQRDGNVVNTIIRESYEESAGSIALTPQEIVNSLTNGYFFYSPSNKILAVYMMDKEQKYSVEQFTERLNIINNDATISPSMKESAAFHLIPISELQSLRDRMATNHPANSLDPVYMVKEDKGSLVRIEKHYGEAFGVQDGSVLNKVIKSFNNST